MTCRKFAPAARNYAVARLAADVGLRINEARMLDLDDVRWELGRFGKLNVRHGKGSRRKGPKPRLVPLINGADRSLRWFIEDVLGLFDIDPSGHGVPLFPSERKNTDGTCMRATADVFRRTAGRRRRSASAELVGEADPACAAALLRISAVPGRNEPVRDPGITRPCLDGHHCPIYPRSRHPCRRRLGDRTTPGRRPMERTDSMKWNLRLAAANRGIWKASELQRMLADRGLIISAGKMSGLWSGNPNVIKLHDLDVICAVLGCGVDELLIPEPETVTAPKPAAETSVGRCRRGPVGHSAGPHRAAPCRPDELLAL